ncbi:hypothetical protein Tco_1237613, partial [Tanacetum coccineum]
MLTLMQHPVNGRAWKNFDTKYPDFAKEPRNVRSGLSAECYKACPTCNKDTPSMCQYLSDEVAKPIIELCLFFKQICSATLIEDDMLKAQSKVVDILCNLELTYPSAFFDIMIHLVIHLPLKAFEGWHIRPEEALTFSSHYFQDVTTKFNHPDSNVDPPPPTCQFQVFRSVCKSIGLRSVIRFDAQELKKVKWYVLHNIPEIDTYRSQFKSLFPNKDMKQKFPEWFGSQICQRHIDNHKDPEVSTTSELFTLACGPTWTPISINSCVVNSVRYVVHSRNDITDVVDQDDDITDDEDALPHDLAYSDDEDLINVDD